MGGEQGCRPRTILILEDDRDIAQLVALPLQELGCAVEVVHHGQAGLRRVRTLSYALIILDLMLPGGDGLAMGHAAPHPAQLQAHLDMNGQGDRTGACRGPGEGSGRFPDHAL